MPVYTDILARHYITLHMCDRCVA